MIGLVLGQLVGGVPVSIPLGLAGVAAWLALMALAVVLEAT